MERKKFGQLAVEKKWITPEEVEEYLALQEKLRGRGKARDKTLFGQLLQEDGLLSHAMVMTLINLQNHSTEFQFKEMERGEAEPFIFGHYRIESCLGAGGMGSVYRATNLNSEIPVAVKIIRGSAYTNKMRARFHREIEILSQMSQQPQLVSIRDYGSIDGVDFYVMDYLEGDTLDRARQRHDLTYREWLKKFLPFLEAVQFLHQQHIIHRDLKQENIFLTTEEDLILLDFGLSKMIRGEEEEEDSSSSLLTTQIVGTPSYMAPEQTYPSGRHDGRTDIWALGVILYNLLTGELPFSGRTTADLLNAVRYEQQKPVHHLNPDVPWQLDAICSGALQKRREDRYQTVEQLADDIRSFLDKKPISTTHLRVLPSTRFRYRRRYLATAYVLGVALLTVAAGLLIQKIWLPGALLIPASFAIFFITWRRQHYAIVVNEESISEEWWGEVHYIGRWTEVVKIDSEKRGRIFITLGKKTWKSPPLAFIKPSNFRQIVLNYADEAYRDSQILIILLQGGDVSDVAGRLHLNPESAQRVTGKTIRKLRNLLVRLSESEL